MVTANSLRQFEAGRRTLSLRSGVLVKGGVVAADGSNFLELDSQTLVDGVFQDVQTQPNVSYTLTFEAQQRPQASGAASVNDTVEVYWRGELVAKVQPGADWSTFTVTVTGSGGVDRLEFREPQGENTTVVH